MELEELFRSRLEGAEMTPGGPVRNNLMRKLGRREFLRFNPSKFNIYYAGGLVAAGLVSTILLTSHPSENKIITNPPPSEKVIIVDSSTAAREKTPPGHENNTTIAETGRTGSLKKVDQRSNISGSSISSGRRSDSGTFIKKSAGNSDSLAKSNQIKERITDRDINRIGLQLKITALFEVPSSSGCLPLKIKFVNRSAAYDSCHWTFGDGGYSTLNNPEWIFDVPGEYKVVLKVFGKDGSEAYSSLIINVYPKPVARFEVQPENPVIPDDEIHMFNYSMDGIKCHWIFGDGKESDAWEPIHKYDNFGNYNLRLIVWSEHGCSDSLTVMNAFAGAGCYIKFPNAFIPNPDGPAGGYYSLKSDEGAQIFHPVTSGVSVYQLRIFSKMGILIFESNDINIGWDGYNKGQLCDPGVYVWKVRGTYKNGEQFVKMGDVTLLKNKNP